MPHSISISGHFHYAHRVTSMKSKCSNLHGHTGNVEVIFGVVKDRKTGFSVDFKDLKNVVKFCLEKYDHKTVIYKNDATLLEVANVLGNHVVIDFEATAENFCFMLYEEISYEASREFGESLEVKVLEIRFSETPNVWVSYPCKHANWF